MGVMERHIRHVLDTHAGSPAYLRRDGRPVLFMFNGHGSGPVGDATLSPAELADVLGRFSNSPVCLVRGHVDAAYLGVAEGAYAWCGDAQYRRWFYDSSREPRETGRLGYRVGVANPGFDDSGVNGWGVGPRVTDRRGTQEYEDQWADVLKALPDAVQIVTWNDFQEGTTVEPTVEYGFTLLNLTERYVRDFTGRASSYEDNQWGYRIYRVREQVEVAADTAAAQRLARRVDQFVEDFVGGSRFLMGWRLKWIERAGSKLGAKSDS
jgi:glycoprotein endo-alpha-1,2-mannosidase